MTEPMRHKYTQPDTILDPELKVFDGILEAAFRHLDASGWTALALQMWRKWQLLLPELIVNRVPEGPEPPPNWTAEEGTQEVEQLGHWNPICSLPDEEGNRQVDSHYLPPPAPPNWIGEGTEWEEQHRPMEDGNDAECSVL